MSEGFYKLGIFSLILEYWPGLTPPSRGKEAIFSVLCDLAVDVPEFVLPQFSKRESY